MRHSKILFFSLVILTASSCGTTEQQTSAPINPLDSFRLVDLSHPYDDETIFWPTGKPFQHEQTSWGISAGGYWYSSYDFALSEHSGTHIDAPIHFGEGKATIGELSLEQLSGPAYVVDISAQSERDANYAATVADFEAFESQHQPIVENSIVLVRSGWSSRWPNVKSYMGDDTPGSAANLHFPGISPAAAEWLANRKVAVVGIDTASIDTGSSTDFQTHQILAAAGIPGLENVMNLDLLPATGATVMALPMKIGNGSGAPCRIVALVPK